MNAERHTESLQVTGYFTGLADVYAQSRPTYPREAIKAILDGLKPPIVVADVGCGTGISTRLLAAAGAHVIGIDPNDDMLKQARCEEVDSARGALEYRVGTGEQTGLGDASVDVVVCAQSFHWFDALAALKEFFRITRPNGRVSLMWNVRDDADSFTAGYGEIVHRAQQDAQRHGRRIGREHAGDPTQGGYFIGSRTHTFANVQHLDRQGLLGRIRSASYFPKIGNPLREILERDLGESFDRWQCDGSVALHYRTEVTRADRAAKPPSSSISAAGQQRAGPLPHD